MASQTSTDAPRGLFVTFEGGEGAGKSTLTGVLAEALREAGRTVVRTREPGASSLGPAIREILLPRTATQLTARTEALLFAAERAQHVSEVIAPALADGAIVLCDRYLDSSVAYQGAGRGLDPRTIRFLSEWGTGGLLPDATFLLDVDPRVGLARKSPEEANHMERLALGVHDAVRGAYLDLAAAEPARFTVLDAGAPIEVNARLCLARLGGMASPAGAMAGR